MASLEISLIVKRMDMEYIARLFNMPLVTTMREGDPYTRDMVQSHTKAN